MTPETYIEKHFGPGETITLPRGKLAMHLVDFAETYDRDDVDPETEAMRDKFDTWLSERIARLKAPTNWVDITAEFVLEMLKEKSQSEWAEVIE